MKKIMSSMGALLCAASLSATDTAADVPSALTLETMTADEIHTRQLMDGHKIIFAGDGEKASADSIARTVSLFYVDQTVISRIPRLPTSFS